MAQRANQNRESRWIHRLSVSVKQHPEILIWLAFILLYAGTCARDVLAADSGEFQLIAAEWGIAHPPGYALYTLMSALWVRLIPIGSIAFRLNLMSAVLAAFTLTLLFKALRIWQHGWGIPQHTAMLTSAIAVIALGSSTTFWAQATTANIRMPTMFFAAWVYAILAEWRTHDHDPRALIKLAIVTGLGVGHHPSLAFVAVGWVLYIALCEPRLILQVRRWLLLVLVTGLAWALPQLYLPIRGAMPDVLFAPDNIASWQGFWFHVLAKGFSGDMFAFITPQDLALRLPLLPNLFNMQFPVALLLCMIVGALWLLAKRPKLAGSLLVSWLIHSFVTITYRAPQTVEYLMPAYIPMALVLGLSMGSLLHALEKHTQVVRRAAHIIPVIMLLVSLVRLPHLTTDYVKIANDTSIRGRLEPLLTQASTHDNAFIMADWRWATPLWYLQDVEHLGEDVTVEYILPEDDTDYDMVWLEKARSTTTQTLFSTHYYSWEDFTFAPVGGGFQLFPQPLTTLDDSLPYTPINVSVGPIDVLAYQVNGDAKPGSLLHLNLAWCFNTESESAPSFATRLWGDRGALLGMSDAWLGDFTTQDGIQFARFTYMLPIDQCGAITTPSIGVYTMENGTFVDLGAINLPGIPMDCTWPELPVERHWYGWLANRGPFLTGVDYDTGVEGVTHAYIRWCGPGPAVNINSDVGQATVQALHPGSCQTVSLPVDEKGLRTVSYTYLDGNGASLISLPVPQPKAGERYTPFSSDMVLVGTQITKNADNNIATLTWRTAQPVVNDYAVSVRVLGTGESGDWREVHDHQPGLGAIPTLKWVQSGLSIIDPHPYTLFEGDLNGMNIVMYERFMMTPLATPYGDLVKYQLP